MRLTNAPATAILLCSLPLLGCGPAPYMEVDGPPPAQAGPVQEQAVVVVLQEPPAEAPADRWVPEEARADNPLGRVRAWRGDYDCPQGNTALTLHILSVRGEHVTALFDFHHVESGDAGRYLMSGKYDGETRRVRLTPGAWIAQPPNYVSVAMSGELSQDGSLFAGKMDHPLCGAFRLRPAH